MMDQRANEKKEEIGSHKEVWQLGANQVKRYQPAERKHA